MSLPKFQSFVQTLKRCFPLLATTVLVGSILQLPATGVGETPRECKVRVLFKNQALSSYNEGVGGAQFNALSEAVISESFIGDNVRLATAGIKDSSGTPVLGSLTGAISDELLEIGFTQTESLQAAIAVTKAWSNLSANPQISEIGLTAKDAIIISVPEKVNKIQELGPQPEQIGRTLANRLLKRILLSTNLTLAEANQATESVQMVQTVERAFQEMAQALPDKKEALAQAQQIWTAELANIRAGVASGIRQGNVISFAFTLTNTSAGTIPFTIPDPTTLQANSVRGSGTVKAIKYQVFDSTKAVTAENIVTQSSTITIPAQSQARVTVDITVGEIPAEGGAVAARLQNDCDNSFVEQTVVRSPHIETPLTDPFGRVTSCTGGLLADYRGFSVGMYDADPNDPTGGVTGLVPLTETELPDIPRNGIPKGIEPNRGNSNPFNLTNSDRGRFSFLFDKTQGQLNQGRTYILLVNPPPGSKYGQRRIRLIMGSTVKNSDGREIVNYTARALDGLPITIVTQSGDPVALANSQNTQSNSELGSFVETGQILVEDAETQGLSLAVMSLRTSVCEATEIQITKTGDRATAEPGDTVIYRLSIRNLSDSPVNNLVVTDDLPLGFQFLPESARGEMSRNPVAIKSSRNGSTISLQATGATLPSGSVMTIAYAARLTPDAFRGTGENSASVNAQRVDNNRPVKDGPSVHRLRIRPGVVSDTGTIIGRVFVDKNFDGEQQQNEPGVPNAIVLMDDGNRITTDPNGLFSVANVLPGYRTGVIDLTSLPGYTLAPNIRFAERNSQSRLVHLAPGGLVRMNFGVTPAFQEGK